MSESSTPESSRSSTTRDEQETHAVEAREPLKQHGDALLDGSGTRHGVDEPDQRPITPG